MKDIFKSGLLGLALIGTLVFASASNLKVANPNNDNNVSIIEDKSIVVEDDKIDKDIHIPQ